jgi:hypothetical protein
MRLQLWMGILGAAVLVAGLAGAEPLEWQKRPWEVISGQLKPHCPALVTAAQTDIGKWTVIGDGQLSLTEDFALFGMSAARLSYAKPQEFVVRFPEPITFRDRIDGCEFWVIGPLKMSKREVAKYSVELKDAGGTRRLVHLVGGASTWAGHPWWGTAAGLLPADLTFPITVTGIVLEVPEASTDDAIVFDAFGAFTRAHADLPDTTRWGWPFPTDPAGVTPDCLSPDPRVSVRQSGSSYEFCFSGGNGQLVYTYTPTTGTLSDLVGAVDGRAAFHPAQKGGIRAEANGVAFAPGDPAIKAELRHRELSGHTLATSWRWTKAGERVDFELDLTLDGRTLTAEYRCLRPVASALDAGFVAGVARPRLFHLAYLNHRWDFPRLLVTDDFFVSVFADWYYSQATELVEGTAGGGLDACAVLGDDAARIMGGAVYHKRTDGTRNPLGEKLRITVAPDLEEVMPDIPNPKSVHYDETGKLIYCTRSYEIQSAPDLPHELKLWQKLVAYGVKDVFVRFHSGQFRTPMENNRFCRSLDGGRYLGGDETIKTLVTALRRLLPRVGPYENNRVIHGLAPEFDYALLSVTSGNEFIEGWDHSYQPKPAAQFQLEQDFAPKFVAKYGWNALYLDELTNTPPWGMVDFDASAPGAGKFLEVLRNYCFLARQMHDYYHGPIWSEGNAMFMFAGYADTDYAQCNQPDEIPIVDFKLRKINALEHVAGYDLTRLDAPLDFLLSAQIVHGSMGHLWDGAGRIYQGQAFRLEVGDYRNIIKSYFMMRQLQELYAASTPESIAYEIDGRRYGATEMLRGNLTNSGFIHTRYANGLDVWVNRHGSEAWTVTVAGQELALPPYGYAASLPGTLLEYSAEVAGHRVDYSRGPLYTYLDGRDTVTEFPELTAKGAYVIFRLDAGTKLVPAPFVEPETVTSHASGNVTALDQEGNELGPVAATAGIAVDGRAFSYRWP